MAPASRDKTPARKAKENGSGEVRQRRGKKSEDDDDDDDDAALLDAGSAGLVDSFIMLKALISIGTIAYQSAQSLFKKDSKDAAADGAGGGPPSGKGDAAKKKDKLVDKLADTDAVKEAAVTQLKEFKIPIMLMVLGAMTCLLIMCGEVANDREERPREAIEDFYGTLGVTRDAETAEVKRAYKTLARRWHPDKNPNCTTCQETFSKIATAYETLADTKKRAAYDESGGVATAELKSPRSVPLTRDNFDQLVTFSNDVWLVQIFKPDDGNCAQFHPFWENQIQKYGHLVRFARVDVTTDLGKWLPVKYRMLPMVLKFGRHLGSPEIFPITAMHETPQQLMKFVLTSFPNIGLPLHADSSSLAGWVRSAGRRHKVLLVIPGRSEEERYKSHLVPRKLAARWSELFEFRTAETSRVHKLVGADMPAEIAGLLPPLTEAGSKAAAIFLSADGDAKPKASALIPWPTTEDELVLQLMSFADMAAPALTPRTADLLCRSPAIQRVYCLVLLDPPDSKVGKAMEELKDSREAYAKEVAEIRSNGGELAEEEQENFMVAGVRLFRRSKGLQPSISTCRAPKFGPIEKELAGSQAFLFDLDTGRFAALKGTTSFRGLYPQIAYEDSLAWIDEVLHPFLSLPDCDEGLLQHFARSARSASVLELVVQAVTLIFLAEALAKAMMEKSLKWALGAGALLLLVLLRSPPFLRRASAYLPGALFAPTLLSS